MYFFTFLLKNLLRRPVRTLLTAAGVALGVGLIVALLSISAGTTRTASDLIHLGRADLCGAKRDTGLVSVPGHEHHRHAAVE